MAKKVGIMTLFYKTYNFGAQLQAYALQKAIEGLGFEAEQIRYKWSKKQIRINYENCNVSKEKFETFAESIPHSTKIYTAANIYDAASEYDCFVCGSDQIWGVRDSMLPYSYSHMTLSFVPDEKCKISYAASFGSAVIDSVVAEIIKSPLNRLDAISIREESGKHSLQTLTKKEIETVLDPTMLLEAEDWKTVAKVPAYRDKYIYVYNISNNQGINNLADKLAAELSVNVIRAGYTKGECIGPREFIGYIQNAEYVLTDSFHGTVFAVLFHKRFISFGYDGIASEYSKNVRIKDLLYKLGLEERFFLYPDECACVAIKKDIDYQDVDRRLKYYREISLAFLNDNLSKKKLNGDIKIVKEKCIGCGVCEMECPQKAIVMKRDELGFVYPSIDDNKCTNCNHCVQCCPVPEYKNEESVADRTMPEVYSFGGNKNIALKSSSGGAFYYLAKEIIEGGGIVYGAAFDDSFRVIHKKAETLDELGALLKSKYVQSNLNGTFAEIKEILRIGCQNVLFGGTPCQVAALKKYVGSADSLYTVDLICGGVTSPELWDRYIAYRKRYMDVRSINMRSKALGTFCGDGHISFHMEIESQDGIRKLFRKEDDLFLCTRLRQAFYRECCYQCEYKGEKHSGDITIGDYIDYNIMYPTAEYQRGVTCVIVNTVKGKKLYNRCKRDADCEERDMHSVTEHNIMYENSLKKNEAYDYLRDMIKECSIEWIFSQAKYVEQINQNEKLTYRLYVEAKRNILLEKVRLFHDYELSVNDVPFVKGKILIYGAGKVGRLLAKAVEFDFEGFIDVNNKMERVDGYIVYHLDDNLNTALKNIDTTIIVTPIWDLTEIKESLRARLPKANIISAEKIVEGL